jgi:hypothetical protein
MNAVQTLEQAAADAFGRGESWASFWKQHSQHIRNAEPWNIRRFHTLYNLLFSLVVSDDANGTQSMADDDPEPWLADDADQQPASDTCTIAHLITMPGTHPTLQA